jgi:hypothetical protein
MYTTTPQQDILLSSHKEARGEAAVLLKYIQRKQQDQSLHKTPSVEASVDTRASVIVHNIEWNLHSKRK